MREDFAVRGHDIAIRDDILGLATALQARELRSLAFAPALSLPEMTDSGEHINVGLANYIRRMLAERDVEIATLSCYVNMIHPDACERAQSVARLSHYLQLAPEFGTRIVVTETGSVDPNFAFTEDNFGDEPFAALLDAIAPLLQTAHENGVFLALEPGINHPVYSLDRVEDVLTYFGYDAALKLVLDPVSLITPGHDRADEILREGFSRFGRQIVAVHIKDYEWTPNASRLIKPVLPGTGHVDMHQLITIAQSCQPYGIKCFDELGNDMLDEVLRMPWISKYQ
ncbi:Xylose isomerase domain-containing protein TIM barrel [Coriobacterium glomerans PW2]|uniref:Xylose isomerase domain-containing protein TIM barrel n=1 Tax=Coriobacterium glomerans (strain ATCC 49209 / DSM 20642 / JCM 10262 / PW2) TaxID=700015 RepID=F2NB14_CORGP|nr:TIM barrel protein [Coriobacterium glomerans]AEB07765.1 Xylose isomerase domain-containing protein TIM barrel [Coriobacterium glomerans PW2]